MLPPGNEDGSGMAREGGFPVDDEDVIETVARMLRTTGEGEAAALLRRSRCRFEKTGYDNLDGGTNIYTLFIQVAAETFAGVSDRRAALEKQIGARLTEAVRQFRSGWYSAELAPLVITLPGRPDLEGGPVSHRTRHAIINLLRDEGIAWQGAVGDVEFLGAIFDLNALPSSDIRFKTAAEDIWQHRVNNQFDWADDWIFSDDRFDLLSGSDVTFLAFVERLVAPTVRPNLREASALAGRINAELRGSGWTLVERETLSGGVRYRIEPWDPLYRRTEQSLRTSAAVLSSAWMHQEIERIEAAIDTDPALAIGTAKEMVETCCKHIAEALKIELPANPDMPDLVKAVLKALRLVPEGIPDASKGAQSIKRTLSSLGQITQGLAELRKLYGTGHGRSASHRSLSTRHARLAVGAAATFVEFVISTYKARNVELEQVA
jgi:hypothetical protein